MDEECQISKSSRYVSWRNKPAIEGQHGGIRAAAFVLVVEVLENLAYLANASNLVLYLSKFMHFSPSRCSNIVSNFMGTAFLLALLGGFLADAFFTTYCIYLISATIELAGLVLLTLQAYTHSLEPESCLSANRNDKCRQVEGGKEAILYVGLYLVALGVGGIKGSLPPHGAEQFDEETTQGRKQRSSFFNYYVFCLACGALIAVTFAVWIEDNKGWQWGFGISTMAILISIPIFLLGSTFYRIKVPTGSPITTICKVLVAAIFNTFSGNARTAHVVSTNPSSRTSSMENIEEEEEENITKELGFLNRAVMNRSTTSPTFKVNIKQVEEVKIVLKIFPVFMSTIMLNCCLAQLSTFSVQQAATMNTKIGSLRVPPASLPVFPVIFIMILAPMYDHVIIPFARKITKTEMGITHLQRIGFGLFLSVMAMAVAALVEIKRKQVAHRATLMNSTEPLPITFLWVSLQYLFLGSADLFSLAGMMDFFFTEAPFSMRSLATSLSWASLAMGYYLSSVLVAIVNHVTGSFRHTPWLYGSNLNHYHLERFYWLMCVLSGLNFLVYLTWAKSYKYRPKSNSGSNDTRMLCNSTGI
ncbi:putative proton-dependent oligopeptide transporter family, MFS transporter superfamily [Helianthus annuus]|uniref:Proton-dependent oligopeptide transporter family, MFS transporter superfamily n=1 Tax=Helianthus annuus TaxID=4232 RepID=A0A251TZS4_HELAN|nr:protein NRT1/ PTR FAMILY 4.6 [Helianthus annuus]KAF5792732.1 putative proton-dependent oligopeptide transporter family, MFS transporter superfamily [Helianthus annuus]KAJ0527645.1 putative proton-dependent oligopeptide transporter family, MFS transporter superfamily [Helianthus annuus]KAJ0544056.1 putative proton-dependent oligopeptide transporter family, MFS transporter superfamily [Helianthus annuus]